MTYVRTRPLARGQAKADVTRHWPLGSGGRLITFRFRVSRRRREMYRGHARLDVCLYVCLSAAACLHYGKDPDVTWGMVGDAS